MVINFSIQALIHRSFSLRQVMTLFFICISVFGFSQQAVQAKADSVQMRCSIDLSGLPKQAAKAFDKAIKEVSALVNGPKIQSTSFSVYHSIANHEIAGFATNARLSFICPEGEYFEDVLLSYSIPVFDTAVGSTPKPPVDTLKQLFDGAWYTGINRWMYDQQKNSILYALKKDSNQLEKQSFIVLRADQPYYQFNVDHQQWSRLVLPTKTINQLIELCEDLKLFEGFSNDQMSTIKQTLLASHVHSFEEFLTTLPLNGIYIYGEADVGYKPHQNITLAISNISKGNFLPENIIDTAKWEKDDAHVYFAFNSQNKKYDTSFVVTSDWVNIAFIPLIQQALTDAKSPLQLYPIYEYKALIGYCMFTPTQYEQIKKLAPSIKVKYTDSEWNQLMSDIMSGKYWKIEH